MSKAAASTVCTAKKSSIRIRIIKNRKGALTVYKRCLYVRVCEPRRFGFPGPALIVPRLDDSVRPTPSTTHLENHPGGASCTSTRLGSAPYSRSILPGWPLQLHLLLLLLLEEEEEKEEGKGGQAGADLTDNS